MKFTLSLCILLAASADIASAEVIYESQFNRGDWQDPREKRPSYPSASQGLNWRKNLTRTENSFIYGGGEYPTKDYTPSAAPSDYTTSRLKPPTRTWYPPPEDETYAHPDSYWRRKDFKLNPNAVNPTHGVYAGLYSRESPHNRDDKYSGRFSVYR